ncbi:PRD domain-containing protein [Faecalibaculum rodentium]|uniref:PRD domain-containing protein n=1 Tax=Faecalibaculum rodentium TaxID=1702221 RepID=UPI001F57DEEF|nr:PRD domain-containing protein [Faecalibaculum rodentium]
MDRFQILLESGVIGQGTWEKTETVRTMLEQQFAPGDTLEMLLIHYAMALERQRRQEEIPALEAAVISEVMQDPRYQAASQLLSRIETETQCSFPVPEQQYLLVHLVNLMPA